MQRQFPNRKASLCRARLCVTHVKFPQYSSDINICTRKGLFNELKGTARGSGSLSNAFPGLPYP
jgi:hypothetical protein